jgi:hypothetical protein
MNMYEASTSAAEHLNILTNRNLDAAMVADHINHGSFVKHK